MAATAMTRDKGTPQVEPRRSNRDGRTATVDATITALSFDGIRKKETYTFSVVATNAVGSSDPAWVTLPAR